MNEKSLYLQGADINEIIRRDCTGRKIDKNLVNANDAEEVAKVFRQVIEKYGLGLHIGKVDKDGKWFKADESMTW